MSKKTNPLENLALISQIGLTMVVTIFIALCTGRWLDDKLGTSPIFLFIFIIMGVISAFINLFKITQRGVGNNKRK